MADDNKPGTNLASSSAIVAALAAMGIYYFHSQAPLVDLRPAVTDTSIQQHAQRQAVEARLWQDPIAAVEKSRDESSEQDPDQRCQRSASDDPCESPMTAADYRVLAVSVRGGSFQEDAEQRRRARYAVLAGLERAGFAPADSRHLNYFLWRNDAQTSPAGFTLNTPEGLPRRIFDFRTPTRVPYERFKNDSGQTVLVLWLKEDLIKDHPLTRIRSLTRFLNIKEGSKFKVIGPFWSGTLLDMVLEATDPAVGLSSGAECKTAANKEKWLALECVEFYAYGASASDERLLCKPPCKTIPQYFASFGIKLHRTIATDDILAKGIVEELNLRGVKSDSVPVDKDERDDVALVSEWDTLYGRALPEVVERKLAKDTAHHHNWIHNFSYLKGLDGLLPSAGKDDTRQDNASDQEKQGGTTSVFKVETDTQSLERPIGQSQFDYLRRISEQLHKIDDGLRKQGLYFSFRKHGFYYKKIKAIGILGSDVFDKLLILRALRPEFPEALFFTTDFDEAFTIKSELPFTRNLIISSSFGPNLSNWLQGEIPYFRDTYETSAFLATQLALGYLHENLQELDYPSSDISNQLRAARLFEVKRTGEILSFAWTPPHDQHIPTRAPNDTKPEGDQIAEREINQGRSVASGWPCWESNAEIQCGNIQPVDPEELKIHSGRGDLKPIEKPFPTFLGKGGEILAAFFALGAIVTTLAACKNWIAKKQLELGFIAVCFIMAAAMCFFWEPLARYLTDDGKGEPIALLGGASLWPTVLLRMVSIFLAIYFIFRTRLDLDNNLGEIAEEMGLDQTIPLPAVYPDWPAYVGRERFWKRCISAFFCTAVMCGIVFLILIPNGGMPFFAYRSPFAYYMYFGIGLLDWLLTLFLIFVVFDATLLCLIFVKKLSCNKKSRPWPSTTRDVYDGRLQLPQIVDPADDLINEWIGLEFVAKRTRCIDHLIYYPFVLLALMILSRSTVFANFAPSMVIILTHGISLLIIFACAIMVWLAAKSARDTARENFTDGIIRAKNSAKTTYFAEQLESLLSRVNQLNDGAFGPLTQQPLVKAFLFPLSSAGWVALIQSGILPGL
jgi:hypothetical protein